MPWGEPCVDGVQEDLNPTHMLRGILQEIRQRAEQMSEQRVRSALRSEVEGQPRHLDRSYASVPQHLAGLLHGKCGTVVAAMLQAS